MGLGPRRSIGVAGATVLLAVVGVGVYATLSHTSPLTLIGAGHPARPAGIDFWQDPDANLAAGNSIGPLIDAMSREPGYAGMRILPYGYEIDLVGKPTAAERAAAARVAPRYQGKTIPYRFRSVRYSEKELKAVMARIEADLDDLSKQGIHPSSWGIDLPSDTVQISLNHYTPHYRTILRARYGHRISVVPYDLQVSND